MSRRYTKIVLAASLVALLSAGCATKQETESVKRGATYGAITGGLMGLAMGALTGDSDMALAGAVSGATMGAATGAMHELKDTRETQRTQILADAIAGKNATPEASQYASHLLHNLLGDWNISAWALADGKRINGEGVAQGSMNSQSKITLSITDIDFPGAAEDMTGKAVFTFDKEKGYTLEISSSTRAETQKYIGEYVQSEGVYNFYATEKERANVRVQLRSNSSSMWSLETYIQTETKEVQTQSYRFMSR